MSAGQYTPGSAGPPEPGPGSTPAGRTAGQPGKTPSYPADAPGQGQIPDSPKHPPMAGSAAERRVTRAGVIWAAVVAALLLLILLIIFILQNQEQVLVKFLGLEGAVPLGMALFIASVTGGVLVAAAGGARILQLRANAHRSRQRR